MTSGEGPIELFMCHDLSTAEMAEVFAADPQRSHDPNLEEQAMRPLWPLALLANLTEDSNKVGHGVSTIGWSFPEGTILKWGAWNKGSALTTGTVIHVVAKHFGVWLRD